VFGRHYGEAHGERRVQHGNSHRVVDFAFV
jgi:hypothetical protein